MTNTEFEPGEDALKEAAVKPRRKKKRDEEPAKRGKGRPAKTTGEKSDYNHVLFKSDVFKSDKAEESLQLSEAQRQERTDQYLEKLGEILQVEASAEYYWRMVFTSTFYLYRSRKQTQLLAGQPTPVKVPNITLRNLAQDARMEYFNLKNLFFGRGTARNVFHLLRFLYGQSIDFNQVQYNESIIDRAYTFLTVLRQEGMEVEEVKRLFYK